MRKHFYLLVLLVLPVFLDAQEVTDAANNIFNNEINSSLVTGAPGLLRPLDLQLQTGASFGSMGMGYGASYFQSYLSPSFMMPLNKNLSVTAGFTYSHTTFNGLPLFKTNGELLEYSGSMNTLTMHTSGIYRANEKLTLTGSAFRSINPSFNARLSPEALQMEAKGFSFGVDYKLGENTHIGAEIRYQQGNSNFLNPYNGYYSPYRQDRSLINNFGFPSGY